MVEALVHKEKKSLWNWSRGEREPGRGKLSARLECNEKTDLGVGRGRAARSGGCGRGDAGELLVAAGGCRASAARSTRRFGRGRDRGQKENAGAPRCARHGDPDRQRRRQGKAG